MWAVVVVMGLLLSVWAPVAAHETYPYTREECDAWMGGRLTQLAPGSVGGIVDSWTPETAADLGLPAGCPPMPFPPASPWCTPDRCVWAPTVMHTDDGLGYCVWNGWRGMWDCHYPLSSPASS